VPLRHCQQRSLAEHFDGGDLGVSSYWIRAEAAIDLAAEQALHSSSRVIGWKTSSSIGGDI
jgi:hypothetical protein